MQRFLPHMTGPLAFSPDNTVLAACDRDGIALWTLTASNSPLVLANSGDVFRPRHWDQLGCVMTFSSDGRRLIAPRNFASERGLFVLSIWDTRSAQEIALLPNDPDHPEHTGTIAALALGPDGHTLATASMDHSIRLWDIDSQELLQVLHGHLSEVWSAAFSPDGTSLFTGAKDGSVDIWAIPPQPKNDLLEGPFVPLAFSKDSRRLAALDEEQGRVLFLNPVTREIQNQFKIERRSFPGPARFALSADFKVLAAAHRNHVTLFNTVSGEK